MIGQVGFHFQLSIAQILHLARDLRRARGRDRRAPQQHVLLWPASALLTGNGVAFVLRVPGTEHGDWWSAARLVDLRRHRGGRAALEVRARWRGEHVFNPSNIGLVICFLVLGRTRAAPLDFWWGPMSLWLALALAVIVGGGFAILCAAGAPARCARLLGLVRSRHRACSPLPGMR